MASSLAEAEALYEAEELQEALERAKLAVQQLRRTNDKENAARALRLQALALIGVGDAEDAESMARAELSGCRAAGDRPGEAMMLLSIGTANLQRKGAGKREEGSQCAQEARAMFAELGDKKMEVEALHVLASGALQLDDKRRGGLEAMPLASRARELSLEMGDRRLEALSLHRLAAGHAAADDFEACIEKADEALDLSLELKDKRLEGFLLLAMARWHLQSGDAERALSEAEDAVEIYQLLRSPKELAAVNVVFLAYMRKDDKRRALRTAKEGLKRFQAAKNKPAEAEMLDMVVSAYIATDRLEEALSAGEKALTIYQDLGNRRMEAKMSSAIAGLYLRMARTDRALQAAEDAVLLFRESGGDTSDKTEALFHVVEAYVQRGDLRGAAEAALEMLTHFKKEGNTKGEAAVLMTMCQVFMKMDNLSEAISSATKAQVILAESGSQFGEASALRMLAEVYSHKDEHKSAVRAAERSRTIFRELGEKTEEAQSLYLVAAESVALAVAEGARVGAPAGSRAATDALNKGTKSVETVLKVSRDLKDAEGLLGSALCIQAQVHMLNGKPDEALAAADEAVVLFRDIGSAISEANALLLSADALRVTRQHRDAGEAASEALRLFQSLSPPDAKGEECAQEILDYLDEIKKQQQQAQQMKHAMSAQPFQMNMTMPIEGYGDVPEQAVSMARQERERGPRGPALDLSSGVDMAIIRAKILEIASRITGAEDGEIEVDTPLMEAGLTSNSAILLRDELAQELPGISLPVTLVFDYPSISSMTELVMEASASRKQALALTARPR
mmetsp:Transcript_43765/g.140335  ORF Transcript_43765/g.140335 Transcript_43765/m.140335 type:complete len:794 (+) Transcript_43765:47-2428(+)